MHRKKIFFIFPIAVFIVAMNMASVSKNDAHTFHSASEKKFFEDHLLMSPIDSDQYFLGSTRCKGCHGYDPLNQGSTTSSGVDVNLYDDWETSMMANAAIDPLWRAKVSQEILTNPLHANELQTKCTACHAPMGRFTAIFHGATHYTIQDLENDTLGLNGVACGGCHMIGTNGLGNVFSGNIPYDTTRKEFGPFLNPMTGPMQLYVGLIPTYSTHMSESKACSPCHTLLTNTADLNGQLTGGTFVEQATYHEWTNSAAQGDNVTCQQCHMPRITDSLLIANGQQGLSRRSPFNQHQFVGGNSFMVQLIKDNKNSLGIGFKPDVNFDSTLAATSRMLLNNTLTIHLTLDSLTMDTAYLKLSIANKAGHKFPSGYPARRSVVQLIVVDENQDTIFKTGMFDSNYFVQFEDSPFEKHHNIINAQDQVQIYEMVMGDVNGNFTTVLERADTTLKDNRIPPEGFLTTHPSYDTMKIVGDAATDSDFNLNTNGSEGSGKDIVHFHIPINGNFGIASATANVFYQQVPPKWLTEMFAISSAPIDSFKNMYLAANRNPVLIATDQLQNIPLSSTAFYNNSSGISIGPNPANEMIWINVQTSLTVSKIETYNSTGKLLSTFMNESSANRLIELKLPEEKGTYFLRLYTSEGILVKKILSIN